MTAFLDFNDVPKHQYRVILADPDWQFKTYSPKGQAKSPGRHYLTPVSPVEHIMSQPVKDMIHPEGAVLFLWATWPTIFQAKDVIEAWGFQYSGLAWEWDKFNHITGKRAFGGGYGTRKNLEPCLLARTKNFKLKTELKNRNTRDLIRSPKRENSRKPDEQYELIEGLFDGPYLELYARQERFGWDAAGNEVTKFGRSGFPVEDQSSTIIV
jgi:N6-adenosine-specific RNA methylase IME4